MNFTMGTHFCGGHAVESALALGYAHLDCGMESETLLCATTAVQAEPCCQNEYLPLGVEEEYQQTRTLIKADLTFVSVVFDTNEPVQKILIMDEAGYADHPPPPLRRSRQILFQSFLI